MFLYNWGMAGCEVGHTSFPPLPAGAFPVAPPAGVKRCHGGILRLCRPLAHA